MIQRSIVILNNIKKYKTRILAIILKINLYQLMIIKKILIIILSHFKINKIMIKFRYNKNNNIMTLMTQFNLLSHQNKMNNWIKNINRISMNIKINNNKIWIQINKIKMNIKMIINKTIIMKSLILLNMITINKMKFKEKILVNLWMNKFMMNIINNKWIIKLDQILRIFRQII